MQTSMDELGRPRGSAGGEILSLHKPDAEAASGGIQRDAAAGRPAADDEDVEGVRGAGADQGGLLDGARRHCGEGVRNSLPDIGEGRSGGAAVVGGDWGVAEDSEVRTTGHGGGGAETSEAYGGCHEGEFAIRMMEFGRARCGIRVMGRGIMGLIQLWD